MMIQPAICGVLALALFGGRAPTAEKTTLERLRALAGDWAIQDSMGKLTNLRATYKVVAGGAAVVETLLADTPEETVTIYPLDGRRVTATQVSRRGAPLRLVPREFERGTMRFGPEEAAAEPGGLVDLRLTPLDEEHLRVEWTLSNGEEGVVTRAFELSRESAVVELAAEVSRMRVDFESLQRELDRRLKREIRLQKGGKSDGILLETRTIPPGPGWNVSGVPFRKTYSEDSIEFASTYADEGDEGLTVAHYGFKAGPGCTVRFSVLGGHAFIFVVEETRAPTRKIRSIPEFAEKLGAGTYGTTIQRIVGQRWTEHPVAVEWDLSAFEGKALRLYVVDAVSNHFGQIAISEISILERAPEK